MTRLMPTPVTSYLPSLDACSGASTRVYRSPSELTRRVDSSSACCSVKSLASSRVSVALRSTPLNERSRKYLSTSAATSRATGLPLGSAASDARGGPASDRQSSEAAATRAAAVTAWANGGFVIRGGVHARGEDSAVDGNGRRSAAEADPGAAAADWAPTRTSRIFSPTKRLCTLVTFTREIHCSRLQVAVVALLLLTSILMTRSSRWFRGARR